MAEATLTEERGRLSIQRIFAAPRERVWKAWTDPEMIAQWWGPAGFTAPVVRVDLRKGGRYHFSMRSPEGQESWSTGEYREIVPMEQLVFTDSFADAEGNVVPASAYGMSGDWPRELLVTVTFEEHGGGTKMILRHEGIPAGEPLEQTEGGWSESLEKLANVLEEGFATSLTAKPGKQEIVITRIFDAPRDLVFKASMDPELLPRWWGPGRFTTTVDVMDARSGGMWRFVQRDAEANEYAFHGVYHEVSPPDRVVDTFEFEGMPGHVMLETVTFEDLGGGRTKMTNRTVAQSVEDRDGMVQSGMEEGVNETLDRLAALLNELQGR
ncbi:SRPBCC domain-containing protein [Methanoculleus caldifontis]|nr:SRPBCC domain-containing protein [Methanoculleus sp. Wushi-C6]